MLFESQKLAPLLGIMVVGFVSFPADPLPPTSPAVASALGSQPRPPATAPRELRHPLRDPFERRGAVPTPVSARAATPATPATRPVTACALPVLPRVTGVVIGHRKRQVFFGSVAVGEGEAIQGVTVTRIERHGLLLSFGGAQTSMPLRWAALPGQPSQSEAVGQASVPVLDRSAGQSARR